MKAKSIEYSSEDTDVTGLGQQMLSSGSCFEDKLNWTWKFYTEIDDSVRYVLLAWKLDWDDVEPGGIRSIDGTITASCISLKKGRFFCPVTVDLKNPGLWVETRIGTIADTLFSWKASSHCNEDRKFSFKFSLNPVLAVPEATFDESFSVSERTDAILIVENKEMHVNKEFLSYHSDFFDKLFHSNFREKTMTKIPINDVEFDDFGRLLSVIQPQSCSIKDEHVEKLLELAERFLMPGVTKFVEMYLESSQMALPRKIRLADQYNMKKLIRSSVKSRQSAEKVQRIVRNSEYGKYSDDTKLLILHHLISFS